MIRKFDLGKLVASPGALEALLRSGQAPEFFIEKHASGDWGDVDRGDQKANEDALRDGGRLVSVYFTLKGDKLWIITEHDRSVTTILLPSEY